jgi:hypothetical protein
MYYIDIKSKIMEVAKADLQYRKLVPMLQQGKMPQKLDNYNMEIDGILLYKNRIFVSNV